jgi:hypothetical protein
MGLAATVVGAGCGGKSDSTSSTAKSIGFRPDRAVYALPLDQIRAIDDGSIGYATNLLIRDCMQRDGFSWPIPAFDPNARPPATWNSTGRRLFDVRIAEQYGYHLALPPSTDGAEAQALNRRRLSPAEARHLNNCRTAVARKIAPPDSRLVDSLAGAAYDAALEADDTVSAARRWRRCMEPQGISDLPDAPNRVPSPSIARRFRLGAIGGVPSAQEVAIATADARCRESSGYARALYDNEVDQQLSLFAKNRNALDRERSAARVNLARARAVISQHGA